jgi:pantothenate kinase type III
MIAVDVGNTRAKFGYFSRQALLSGFPQPESYIKISHNKNNSHNNNLFNNADKKSIAEWLYNVQGNDDWFISITASDCKADSLISELFSIKPDGHFKVLTNVDVPISANVDSPATTGIDRLFDALAAAKFATDKLQRNNIANNTVSNITVANNDSNVDSNIDSINTPDQHNIETIIVVDAGTAITIDVVKVNVNPAVFEGGVILAGLGLLSIALNYSASRLPQVEVAQFNSSDLIYPAKNTTSAILAGILGSQIAAINFFARKVESGNTVKPDPKIHIIFAGGDAETIGNLFAREFPEYSLSIIPDLTLIGIAVSVGRGVY